MPYGIKTASNIFQRTIEQVLVENMVCYQDNICNGATNENELKKKTDIVLNRLRNIGMTINKESKDKTEEEFEDTFLHWVFVFR